MTARSDLKLRFLPAAVFTPLFAAAVLAFAFRAARADFGDPLGPGVLVAPAVICGLLTVTAVITLVVAARRPSGTRPATSGTDRVRARAAGGRQTGSAVSEREGRHNPFRAIPQGDQ
ncbi:hypothetical protein ABZ519_40860 [Streptomyces collinus]|uniref:hypothetical protein n=1 Tax=Streptomyces collinus TaxID=42684 RepID=UPI0033C4CF7E